MGSKFNASGAFSSERLNYTALDPKDEEASAFIYELCNDPEMSLQGSNDLLKPEDRAYTDKLFDAIARGLMALAIRVKPEADNQQVHDRWSGQRDSFPKIKGRMIGYVSLGPLGVPQHRSCNLGVSINAEFQGKGFGTEAVNWIIDAGFRRANLHSITLSVFSFNPAFKLYERLGFKVDGRRRHAIWFDGQWHDTIIMSMLEDEWREIRRIK